MAKNTSRKTKNEENTVANLNNDNLEALANAEQERKDMGTVDLAAPVAPMPLPVEQAQALTAGAAADPAALLAALESQRNALLAQIEAQKAERVAEIEARLTPAIEQLKIDTDYRDGAEKRRASSQMVVDSILAELRAAAPERFAAPVKGKKGAASKTEGTTPARTTYGPSKNRLSGKAIEVLRILKTIPNGASKGLLWEKVKAGSALLGAGTKIDSAPDTMVGRGLIAPFLTEGGRGIGYTITPAGEQALEQIETA